MKKLSTISLFIFGVIIIAILTAGLVFYQNNKDSQIAGSSQNTNLIQNAISKNGTSVKVTTSIPIKTTQNTTVNTNNAGITTNTNTTKTNNTTKKSLTLNISEIKKHNTQNDCWLLISGKVYDITSYFGSHPGGNKTMSLTCGTDATNAYLTQDPYAASSTSRSAHSSRAKSLLGNYYLGDLNQTISQ